MATQLKFHKKEPKDLLNFTKEDYIKLLGINDEKYLRYKKLFDRNASLLFELEKYFNMGIKIVTRADKSYPQRLKQVLAEKCPPLFYYIGDLGIANDTFIGLVGSRDVGEDDSQFAKNIVKNVVKNKFSIVSGGARGIDSISTQEALRLGGASMEFISDSLISKIKDKELSGHIRDGRVLVLSSANPNAGFNTGMAMARNKFIYASSEATVVVKSDFGKGGTWTGAVENISNSWTTAYCWNNEKYKGNIELIKKGLIPIDDNFKGEKIEQKRAKSKQLSMFAL